MKSSILKILQIGSGSMGTRRLRDLHKRKDVTIALHDTRADRRARAQARFGVNVFEKLDDALAWEPGALIISTPPGSKGDYIDLALKQRLHHFSEADIWTYGAAPRSAKAKGLVSAPSASLRFVPVVKGLADLVQRHLGSILSYEHALGTYMPGWHADEGKEYYGRHRDTAPAREMVCFELTWLNAIFGGAVKVAGHFEKFGDLPGKTEDTWGLLMRLKGGGLGSLTSTMASRDEFRRGSCIGTKGFAAWDISTGEIEIRTAGEKEARRHHFGAIGDVVEPTYAVEINTFVDAVLGRKAWPQTYALSQSSTATLAAAEQSSATGQWVKVDPRAEPHRSPPRS